VRRPHEHTLNPEAAQRPIPDVEIARPAPQPIPQLSLCDMPRLNWLLRTDPKRATREIGRRYGPIVKVSRGPLTIIHLYGPDACKLVLQNRGEFLSNKKAWDLLIGRIFTNGLMLRDGEDHRFHRRILLEAFRRSSLEAYIEQMNPLIASGLESFGAQPQPMRILPAFKSLTLDLASAVFLGIELGPQAERVKQAFEAAVGASMALVRLRIPGTNFSRGLAAREFLADYFGSLIAARRAGQGSDMFSSLCRAEGESGERFTDREIVDHMIFLMMAAHDTTTSALTSMVYALGRHSEWQERVRAECRALGSPELAFADQVGLEVTNRVIKETLRMWPPLASIPQVSLREFEFAGYRVPAGAMVTVWPIHTHYMPEWWSEPERFDPDRFAPERAEDERHSHSWIPFSAGPHVCIGMRFAEMQIRAIVHRLVRSYRWSVPAGYEMPVQQAPISRPRDGLPVSLERLG
jgi:cytochrome P450